MEKKLMIVALRQKALYLPDIKPIAEITEPTLSLLHELKKIGFSVTECLLHALNGLDVSSQKEIVSAMNAVMGTMLNWTPLVKDWKDSTGQTQDHQIITAIINSFKIKNIPKETLPCGHSIPTELFHLDRYNGCPFCGKPFVTTKNVNYGQGSKLKELDLWTDKEMLVHRDALITSSTPLDASQADSLKILLSHYGVPDNIEPSNKETTMLIIDQLVYESKITEAGKLFKTPTDIMRYLWYKHTGYLQIVEPSTIISNIANNGNGNILKKGKFNRARKEASKKLHLHYDRRQCWVVATWLNNLNMRPELACEDMHPKREMWVRFIRALRFSEFSKKEGFNNLSALLDCFYNHRYEVFAGKIEKARKDKKASTAFKLLKMRPGIFARSLFSDMLLFGRKRTLKNFNEVADKVPLRLLFTLSMYAEDYFSPYHNKVVHPLGSAAVHTVGPNKHIAEYNSYSLNAMIEGVKKTTLDAMKQHYAQSEELKDKKIWIEPQLYNIPLSIGERTTTIQDISCALPGTVFPVIGNEVRLFLQWGVGLPAQYMDMDLSCALIGIGKAYECAYYQLTVPGAQHSGDIQNIPDKVGTAEYIELDIPKLKQEGIKFVVFTCNAYSAGSLAPNLMVGWMDSKQKMKVSNKTGVSYDPSTVQHVIRISESNLSKGLVFGVLRVATNDILWLEMPFQGQTIRSMNLEGLSALMNKLESRVKIGDALAIKAKTQHGTIVKDANQADIKFDNKWAHDTAKVSNYLLG